MEKSSLKPLFLLPLVGVVGCDLSPKDEDIVSSGGLVNKGILAQAVATAYKAGTTEVVKRVYTQSDGTFSLDDVNFDGTLYVEVATTSQTLATCDGANGCGDFPGGLKLAGESDKNLNGRIDFGDKYFFNDGEFILSAYVIKSEDGSRKFAVTPLTHLAAASLKNNGNINSENIQRVNAQIAELFGLDGADLTRMVPPDITNLDQMTNASPAQRMYAALNAAVASAATSSNSVAAVINELTKTFVEQGGLISNSSDPTKVTLASLQALADAVANVVEIELQGVDMDLVQQQIQQELAEQLSKTPDSITKPSNNPVLKPDFDRDGLSDSREKELGTDPYDADTDDDGLKDGAEISAGTNPLNADTDSDGMPDGFEVLYSLDPLSDDSQLDPDGDQLTNIEEFNAGSNPNNSDTDADGIDDSKEVIDFGTNPSSPDSDGDGLTDWDELNTYLTDPNKGDTDNDGMRDGWEIAFSLDPLNASDAALDPDADGLTNVQEHLLNTNPNSNDTDGDGILDGDEDFDSDGLPNIYEVAKGFDPFTSNGQNDPDGDTRTNLVEFEEGSDPFVANPTIEFVSDASFYANASSGNMELSLDETSVIGSSYDLTDLAFVDAVSDTNTRQDVISHELDISKYELPVRQNGLLALLSNGSSTFQDMTLDNLTMLFSSSSTQVVLGDLNAKTDLFVFDQLKQSSLRVTRSDLTELNNDSYPGRISQDARYVVFKTAATNFAGISDSNANNDIYRFNTNTKQSVLISRTQASATTTGNGNSYEPDMSANGNRIVFSSAANNLSALTDSNGTSDIYFYEVSTNSMRRVSRTVVAADDTSTPPAASYPMISANGKALVYVTTKNILGLSAGVPAYQQIYYVDVDRLLAGDSVSQYTTLITKDWNNSNVYGDSFIDPASIRISADGGRVYYKSASQNLAENDSNAASIDDLFMWDRASNKNYLLSQFVYGTNSNGTPKFDFDPTNNHTNGMGIQNFLMNGDGTHIYAILDHGHEYTDIPASAMDGTGTNCTLSTNYCLYKITLYLPQQDSDNDGLTDVSEEAAFTDPFDADTDNDGLTDGVEINTTKTSPIRPDTDGDGENDGVEVSNGTDPLDDNDPPSV